MNLCHNRYGKTAEFMVKCQQRLDLCVFTGYHSICLYIN